MVDGDLGGGRDLPLDGSGRWEMQVDTSSMIHPKTQHRLVVWSPGSKPTGLNFSVDRAWTVLADIEDPRGDDHGPHGTYVYPNETGYAGNHPMDLRRVGVSSAGSALRLDLSMASISSAWNPPNGFDHVAFTIFIELPGQAEASELMPLQGGRLPSGMRWHRRLRVHGWSNAMFSAQGATATSEGTPVASSAEVSVDQVDKTVSLKLSPASLGQGVSLHGARIYITTWDYDGGYRALGREAALFEFGGGGPHQDPLVMDDTRVIQLP